MHLDNIEIYDQPRSASVSTSQGIVLNLVEDGLGARRTALLSRQ